MGFLIFVLLPCRALAEPQLHGNSKIAECMDAFKFAKYSYYSQGFELYTPRKMPDDLGSKMVLGTLDQDISKGGSLYANTDVFEVLPNIQAAAYGRENISSQTIFWEKKPISQTRIVVIDTPFNWEGDWYYLYLINATQTENDFLHALNQCASQTTESQCIRALFDGTWRPQLVFQDEATSKLWFINVGEPYQILGDWNVYLQSPRGYKAECTITFDGPKDDHFSYLPPSVRKLARLLDDTLGAGMNEGTLQPTATLRLQVSKAWANAFWRPWALTDGDRYNSKTEVDAGLKEWSKKGPAYLKVYKQIVTTYPVAERELAAYYQRHFKLNHRGAAQLAKYTLEIVYCANFTFSGGDYLRYQHVDNNPWPHIERY